MIYANISCKTIAKEVSKTVSSHIKQKSFLVNGSMLLESVIKERSADFLIIFSMKRRFKNLFLKMKNFLKKNLKEMAKQILEFIMLILEINKCCKSSNQIILNH